MRMIVVLAVMLAIVGTSAAWTIQDQLQYTYTKSMYQQAGDDLVKPSLVGATSQASFFDPGNPDGDVYSSQAKVENELTGVLVDRYVLFPAADLRNADFYATLTQGGAATVNLQAMNCVDNSVPEMAGEANAYQNLQIAGGFDTAAATFDSKAMVGTDGIWTVTSTGPTDPLAYVDAESMGGGEIKAASLGEKIQADVSRDWDGTGWATPSYSGGITMWALFDAACDPTCANPIVSSVDGDAWTSIFPGDVASPDWGGDYYWGDNWATNPEPQNPGNFPDGPFGGPAVEDDNIVGDIPDPASW